MQCFECEYLDKKKYICKKKNKKLYKNFHSEVHKKTVRLFKMPEYCKQFKKFDYKKFYKLLEGLRKGE